MTRKLMKNVLTWLKYYGKKSVAKGEKSQKHTFMKNGKEFVVIYVSMSRDTSLDATTQSWRLVDASGKFIQATIQTFKSRDKEYGWFLQQEIGI